MKRSKKKKEPDESLDGGDAVHVLLVRYRSLTDPLTPPPLPPPPPTH